MAFEWFIDLTIWLYVRVGFVGRVVEWIMNSISRVARTGKLRGAVRSEGEVACGEGAGVVLCPRSCVSVRGIVV